MTSIKRGVSLYSLQDAYGRGGLGLEGTIAAVEKMGTQGIEFLSDQMLTGAQKASENTLREWDAIIERHPLDLVSNDIFVNSTLYRNRTLTLEEQAELLSSDLRLANRLGFRLVRVVSRTDPRLIKMTVDLAEKLDVTMAVEIQAGMSFDHPLTAGWINEMKRIGSDHLGIVAVSMGGSNEFVECFCWGAVVEGGSGAVVELVGDGVEVWLVAGDGGSFG